MNDIEKLKKDLSRTLDEIDKEKLSLPDLKLYAEIVKTVSEIQSKSYLEQMTMALSGGICNMPSYKPETVGNLKGGE